MKKYAAFFLSVIMALSLCNYALADSRDDNALAGQTVEKATEEVRQFLADAGEEDTLDVYLILKDIDEYRFGCLLILNNDFICK